MLIHPEYQSDKYKTAYLMYKNKFIFDDNNDDITLQLNEVTFQNMLDNLNNVKLNGGSSKTGYIKSGTKFNDIKNKKVYVLYTKNDKKYIKKKSSKIGKFYYKLINY